MSSPTGDSGVEPMGEAGRPESTADPATAADGLTGAAAPGNGPAAPASATGATGPAGLVPPGGPGETQEELVLELARAEAERDAAVAALDKRGRRKRLGRKLRQIVAAILVVLFCILLPVTYVVTWTHYTTLNTKGFVDTVKPIGTDPAVIAVASADLTNQIYTSLNPQQTIAGFLPPKASFLAAPIANGLKGYVQTAINKVLSSSQFQTLWVQALTFAHTQLISVLNGNSKAVTTSNGQVVLDLVPLLNNALQSMSGFISGVVGKPVKLPAITASTVPSTACKQISNAIGRTLPDNCAQIPLFPADKLDQARHAVRLFNAIMILLLILTPVVAALALWASRRKRRTLLQLSAGGVLGLVVIRRVVIWLENTLANTGQPANKPARRAILSYLFRNYFAVSRWVLLGLLVVFLAALVTGPYPWAVSLRRAAARFGTQVWNALGVVYGRARDDSTVEWIRSHLSLLQILGVALAIILLIALSVGWVGFLVIIVLLAAYEYWLYWFGKRAQALAAASSTAESSSSGPPDDRPPSTGAAGPAAAV
jgi:hypothetical protein